MLAYMSRKRHQRGDQSRCPKRQRQIPFDIDLFDEKDQQDLRYRIGVKIILHRAGKIGQISKGAKAVERCFFRNVEIFRSREDNIKEKT